jgi:hypothetical protein
MMDCGLQLARSTGEFFPLHAGQSVVLKSWQSSDVKQPAAKLAAMQSIGVTIFSHKKTKTVSAVAIVTHPTKPPMVMKLQIKLVKPNTISNRSTAMRSILCIAGEVMMFSTSDISVKNGATRDTSAGRTARMNT